MLIESLLEAIGAPACVATADGRILRADAAGTELKSDGKLTAKVKAVLHSPREHPNVEIRLIAATRRARYLVVFRDTIAIVEARATRASAVWGFTRRQRQVLSHLVRGDDNKTIARCLGCAVRTVDQHVHTILEKSGTSSRTVLVFKVLAELADAYHSDP